MAQQSITSKTPKRIPGGMFIVFEGGEFVGKTTQVERLAKLLTEDGYDVVVTREPGGTEKGIQLRKKALGQDLSKEEELEVFLEDRRIHVAEVIKPALQNGKIVICDRFSDSTVVYQHYGREKYDRIPLDEIYQKDAQVRDGINPNMVFVFDLDPIKARGRVSGANYKENRERSVFEARPMNFHRRVRDGFRVIANNNSRTHIFLSARGNVERITAKVYERVADFIDHTLEQRDSS